MQSFAPIFWALVLVPLIILVKDNPPLYVILSILFVLLIVYHSISPEEWESMKPKEEADTMDDYVSILDVYKDNIEKEERESLAQGKEESND